MKLKHLAAAGLALAIAAGALAQGKPEDEIRYRQSVMNVIGHAFGPMIAMAQGKIPYDKAVVAKNSNLIEALIGLPWPAFGPGTDKGAPTQASKKIWSEPAKFKHASDNVQQAVADLDKTAQGGDEKTVKVALGHLGKACKACHDDFRTKEFHRN